MASSSSAAPASETSAAPERPAMPKRQLGVGSLALTVFMHHLRLYVRARKTLVLGLVMCLPVLAALFYLSRGATGGVALYKSLVEYVVIAFLLPTLALFYGGPTVVDEIEGRTATYLFLRPVPKEALYLGKLGASMVLTAGLTLLPLIALYVSATLAGSSPADHLQLLSQGAVSLLVGGLVYTSIFSALGALSARSLLGGLVFWGVVEWGLSFVPVLEVASVKYHLRNAGSLLDPGDFGRLDQMVLDKPIEIPLWGSYVYLVVLIVGAAALGAWAFRSKQYPV